MKKSAISKGSRKKKSYLESKSKKFQPEKGLFLGAPCNSGNWSHNAWTFLKIHILTKYSVPEKSAISILSELR